MRIETDAGTSSGLTTLSVVVPAGSVCDSEDEPEATELADASALRVADETAGSGTAPWAAAAVDSLAASTSTAGCSAEISSTGRSLTILNALFR